MKKNLSSARLLLTLTLPALLASLTVAGLCACTGKPAAPADTPTLPPESPETPAPEGDASAAEETAEEETGTPAPDGVVLAVKGQETSLRLICARAESKRIAGAEKQITEAFADRMGVNVKQYTDSSAESPLEIIIGKGRRPGMNALTKELGADEYIIRLVSDGEKHAVQIAYNGKYAMLCAIDRFVQTFVGEDMAFIPFGTEIRGHCSEEEAIITSSIPQLRDPCVLRTEDGTYYAYGTGWVYYKNTSGSLSGRWKGPYSCVEKPAGADDNYWAPEVHIYNGAYYMFTTYYSKETGRRGVTILRADSPEGPFREITGGQITPREWDAIDGTLYVDPEGQPWMIFVHEWVSAPEGVGRMAAARLSADLTHFIEEPRDVFRADDPAWSAAQVTDGCWLWRTAEGKLLMIWSNWDSHGYCVGIAESDDGTPFGNWIQSDRRLFSKTAYGTYDGGHSMIFRDGDGQLYLSLHSPNNADAGRHETPVFIPVREDHGRLVTDLWNGD